ncbi:MAG TPA: FecR domain-containing protein [Chloroflexota bacterium]
MLDNASWERIVRYALGECSAEEAIELRAWIEEDPERRALAQELMRIADAGPGKAWDAQAAWRRFRESVDESASPGVVVFPSPKVRPIGPYRVAARRRSVRRWLAAAAAIAALLAAGSTGIWRYVLGPAAASVAVEDLRTVETRPGQTAELYLSDGTRVVLAPASKLRFPASFRGPRNVYLEGEAYFDVADVRRLPWTRKREFTVHTERAIARDLGTRFSVRAYPGAEITEVVVAEGAVALGPAAPESGDTRATAAELVLSAGDLGRLDGSGALTAVRGIDVDAYHGWMEGRLAFTDAPVGEVLEQFRRWFGVEIRLGSQALERARLTATFDVHAPTEALKLLAMVLDARLERDGETVVLYPRGSGR